MSADKEKQPPIKLPLADELAVERTRLANERTLLAYIRSSMYFLVAGLTINSFFNIPMGWLLEVGFWVVAFGILISGIIRYRMMAKKLRVHNLANRRWHLLLEED